MGFICSSTDTTLNIFAILTAGRTCAQEVIFLYMLPNLYVPIKGTQHFIDLASQTNQSGCVFVVEYKKCVLLTCERIQLLLKSLCD